MTTWKFRIANTGANIDQLARSAGSRQDFSICREEPDDGHISYWLSSPWLDGVTNLQDLSNRLSGVRCLVDGAILLGGGDRLVLGSPVDVATEASTQLPEPSLPEGLEALRTSVAPNRSRGVTQLAVDEVSMAVFLARHDEAVRGCLLCLGYSGVTFVSLYQCRDFMKLESSSRTAALQVCGVKDQDMRRFDHTANNFEASGPAGRHGDLGHGPPAKPMLESEARGVLIPVIRAFVGERAKAVDIQALWRKLPA